MDNNKNKKEAADEKALEPLLYPPGQDIYNKGEKQGDIDPANLSSKKKIVKGTDVERKNEKSFEEDVAADDLDVPGAELDDDLEDIGSEDEENNYYSLGGDNHNDLEEDKGD